MRGQRPSQRRRLLDREAERQPRQFARDPVQVVGLRIETHATLACRQRAEFDEHDSARTLQVTESSKSGGEQQNVTYSFLEEDDEHQIPTSKSALSFTLTMADDPALPHNDVLLEADDDKKPRAVRVNLASGGVIAYNAYASFDNVPSMTKNNIMAVTAVFAVVAKFIRYAA